MCGRSLTAPHGVAGMKACVDKAQELAASIPDSYILNQFSNPNNPQVHYETTGPEIWDACEEESRQIDFLVCGVGTGGTISGAGKFLKEKNPNLKVGLAEEEARLLFHASSSLRMGIVVLDTPKAHFATWLSIRQRVCACIFMSYVMHWRASGKSFQDSRVNTCREQIRLEQNTRS